MMGDKLAENGQKLQILAPSKLPTKNMRTRLIEILATTADSDFPERAYPTRAANSGSPFASGSRSPVLRIRGGSRGAVPGVEAKAGAGSAAPVPRGPSPDKGPEKAGNAVSGPGGAESEAGGGAPKRRLAIRTSGAAVAPPGAISGANQDMSTRSPLLPLPKDGNSAPPFASPMPPLPKLPPVPSSSVKYPRKKSIRRTKKPMFGRRLAIGAGLACLLLVGAFWGHRSGVDGLVLTWLGVSTVEAPVVSRVETPPDRPITQRVSEPPVAAPKVVAIGELATVAGSSSWDMADAGWAPVVPPTGGGPGKAAAGKAPAVSEPVTKPSPAPAPKPAPAHTSPAEPKRPTASKAFQQFVEGLRVTGVVRQTPVRAIIDGGTVFAGDIIEPTMGIRFTGADFEQRQLIFEDRNRAQLKIYF